MYCIPTLKSPCEALVLMRCELDIGAPAMKPERRVMTADRMRRCSVQAGASLYTLASMGCSSRCCALRCLRLLTCSHMPAHAHERRSHPLAETFQWHMLPDRGRECLLHHGSLLEAERKEI